MYLLSRCADNPLTGSTKLANIRALTRMGLKAIGKSKGKTVFLTDHAVDRLKEKERYMSFDEVLGLLENRQVCYPIDATGAQKIRGTIGGKECFLVINESDTEIVVVTGGKK